MKKLILAVVVVASIAGVANAGPLDNFISRVSSAITTLSNNDVTLNNKIIDLRAGDIAINGDRVVGVDSNLVGGAIVQLSRIVAEQGELIASLKEEINILRSDVSRHVTDDAIHFERN